MVRPPPEEEETPEDEEETPDEEEIPDEDEPAEEDVPDEDEEVPVEVPAPAPVDEAPPEPAAPDEPPTERCGSEGVTCATFAPITAAAPAESSPIRQVIFLTRLRPSSRTRVSLEYWVRFIPKSRRRISVTERSRIWAG